MPTPTSLAVPTGADIRTSIVRTVTLVLAGALVTFAVWARVDIDPAVAATLVLPLVQAGVTVAWYVAARLFEVYVSPRFGWLLGSPRPAIYPAPADADTSDGGATPDPLDTAWPGDAGVAALPVARHGLYAVLASLVLLTLALLVLRDPSLAGWAGKAWSVIYDAGRAWTSAGTVGPLG